MRKVYLIEVGVLLAKDDPEYDFYSKVYDKKHAFYDENQYYVDTLNQAKHDAKEYVEQGVDNTYAIISSSALPDDIDVEEALTKNESYSIKDVVYSLKKENDKLIENFLGNAD